MKSVFKERGAWEEMSSYVSKFIPDPFLFFFFFPSFKEIKLF